MLRPHGAVSLLTVVFLLVLVAAGYAGWLVVPVYLDNLDMREAVTAAFNRMAADPDDGRVKTYLLSRANHIGTHWETNAGERVEKPGLDLAEQDVVIEHESASGSNTGRVAVDYQREVRLWPTDKFQTFDFHVEKAGTLAR